MRKEYDLKKLKVKRHGLLPEVAASSLEHAKIRITISLDKDVIDYFKDEAKQPGALPYQTQINQALRSLLPTSDEHSELYEQIKEELLQDQKFIFSLKHILIQQNPST